MFLTKERRNNFISNLIYNFKKSYDDFDKYTKSTDVMSDDFEFNRLLRHLLQDAMDLIERLPKNKREKFNAYRFANNQLKHNHLIIKVHTIDGGLAFSEDGIPLGEIKDDGMIESLFCFPQMSYIWRNIEQNEVERKKYIEMYKSKLEGKPITETVDLLYKLIFEEI